MAKKGIHPIMHNVNISCSTCHANFEMLSTRDKDFKIDTCSYCHPFYTGKQMFASAGRVEKFRTKMMKKTAFKKREEKNKK